MRGKADETEHLSGDGIFYLSLAPPSSVFSLNGKIKFLAAYCAA